MASEMHLEASEVVCSGRVLDAVQRERVFPEDSKTFVDLRLRVDPETVLRAFDALPERSTETLRNFVETYFAAGEDLEPWTPDDWVADPPSLEKIPEKWRAWARDLIVRWKDLGRRQSRAKQSSLLRTGPFVAPGGRFREIYYWDSFWIVKGLLASDMLRTARTVMENLLSFVETIGFVPNGGRLYYLHRSQPPLLSEMVTAYLDRAMDDDVVGFTRRAVRLLVVEYDWWMTERTVQVGPHVLNRYWTNATTPRPEAYREDVATAEGARNNTAEVYRNLAAACESGWDFSSRWMRGGRGLSTTSTTAVVPVDLNAIMLRFETNLAVLHDVLHLVDHGGEMRSAWRDKGLIDGPGRRFATAAIKRRAAIQAVLWRNGCWKDFWLLPNDASAAMYASDFAMLWANVADDMTDATQDAIVEKLERSGLLQAGGVVTSTVESGQQWDAPNAWPPLQYFVIEGLKNLRIPRAHRLAGDLASRWLRSNFTAWHATGHMYEKYNAYHPGTTGNGGEYEPQLGFGWTNGVVLDLLTHSSSEEEEEHLDN